MSIEPPKRRGQHERGRMVAQGRNTDDNRASTLLVVAENDGSWTFHGLGVLGVKISKSDAVDLAQTYPRGRSRRCRIAVRHSPTSRGCAHESPVGRSVHAVRDRRYRRSTDPGPGGRSVLTASGVQPSTERLALIRAAKRMPIRSMSAPPLPRSQQDPPGCGNKRPRSSRYSGPRRGFAPVKWPDLLARAQALVDVGDRRILGITGAPGSGKSTVARRLVDELGDAAVLVGMDGYHLAQAELERLGCAERKGAPDTFDAAGYVALLHRLRARCAGPVYAPEFRRAIEEPIAGAVPVPPRVRLVVTEGNYLLLDTAPWSAIRELLDEVWFLATDEQTRRAWLTARHRRYGRSAKLAAERTTGTDERNARLIASTASRADLILDPTRLI